MRIFQRLLAFCVATAFTVAIGGSYTQLVRAPSLVIGPPALLPAAQANPAEFGVADTLRAGETLTSLLNRAHLAEAEVQALLDELHQFQDPRRLKAGSVISYRRAYETGDVRGLAFHIDPDRTVTLYRAGESWAGSLEEVPVVTDSVLLSGTVESSLYAALLKGHGGGIPESERRAIADILADRIFAWQLDFSRDLRVGDQFRILYERLVRPDGTARNGRVLSVQFSVNNRDYEAYLYRTPDGTEDYYAGDGESLRRAFLRAPLEFRRISSAFTMSRFHPVLKTNRPHLGVDYAAAPGTPVRAVGDGTIRTAGWNSGGYGNLVEIAHSRGYASRYAHLQRVGAGIRPGVRVKQGDIIGYVGSTGLATGPHLHYEFHSGGRAVNPNTITSIVGDPVPGRYRNDFLARRREQIAAMERLSPEARYANNAAAVGRLAE
jgi:murein DD-endopeptidase MepM/ murein hydrolase activator NlpD